MMRWQADIIETILELCWKAWKDPWDRFANVRVCIRTETSFLFLIVRILNLAIPGLSRKWW